MRQIRLQDTAAQSVWRVPNSVDGMDDIVHQLVYVERATVGEFSLGEGPNTFVRIKFRSVSWKVLYPQARVAAEQPRHWFALVRGGIIQQGDDETPEMPEQLAEKQAHFFLPDVVEVKQIVEA